MRDFKTQSTTNKNTSLYIDGRKKAEVPHQVSN